MGLKYPSDITYYKDKDTLVYWSFPGEHIYQMTDRMRSSRVENKIDSTYGDFRTIRRRLSKDTDLLQLINEIYWCSY
ncbi:MAG: hypothetical protein Ta2E_13330 [Mycoplasmoidaceae bacterium]|nr:MAG: hypothetical protein Ta2E_13330 [Mycoplasmoidaceae bacterium]